MVLPEREPAPSFSPSVLQSLQIVSVTSFAPLASLEPVAAGVFIIPVFPDGRVSTATTATTAIAVITTAGGGGSVDNVGHLICTSGLA